MVEKTTKKKKRSIHRNTESKEKELIDLAMDLAFKQMSDGTATAQVITYFLKLGSVAANLTNLKTENENALLKAKVEALASRKKIEELYLKALDAMKLYSGNEGGSFDDV